MAKISQLRALLSGRMSHCCAALALGTLLSCASQSQSFVTVPPCPGVVSDPDAVPGGPNGEGVEVEASITNRPEIVDAMIAEYQPLIRGNPNPPMGTARVWMLIDPRGAVAHAEIAETSGLRPIDKAAIRVALVYRFDPVVREECSVPAWVQLPLTFQVR